MASTANEAQLVRVRIDANSKAYSALASGLKRVRQTMNEYFDGNSAKAP